MSEFDVQVPLDRDEEAERQVRDGSVGEPDAGVQLLFRTRVSALNPRRPIVVPVGASVAEACSRMREARVGSILVMKGSELVGIFTERDVLYRVTGDQRDPAEIRIEELMTPNPTVLRANHRLAHVLNKMSLDGCRHIPIVDKSGRPVGVVSVRRIVDFLVEAFADNLQTLPPDPDQEMSRVDGG